MYLAADTGKMNGVAHFDINGNLIFFDQLTLDEFDRHLDELDGKLTAAMYEEYIVDPRYNRNGKMATAGSRNEASQGIGMLKSHCRRNQIPMWPVQRHNKAEGYAWSNPKIEPTNNHKDSHWRDAVAIGTYWLVKNRIIKQGTIPLDAY